MFRFYISLLVWSRISFTKIISKKLVGFFSNKFWSKTSVTAGIKSRLTSNDNFAANIYLHIIRYCTAANLTYSWSFGSLLGFYYALQVITGILLSSFYTPSMEQAFATATFIGQDSKFGPIIRSMHANGASMIFILLYLHVARGLYFRSYSLSRIPVWLTGLLIMVLMMATAFMGYVLPWGQMSYWGVTVITNLVTTIPLIGQDLHAWLLGGFSVSSATLRRFYGLHVILPIVIGVLIVIHIYVVHKVGSTSGTQVKDDDKTGFHPYFSSKDVYGLLSSLWIFGYLVFFEPNLLGHSDNYTQADPTTTPVHIVPEWYFTPFYAILRACPDKAGGAISMVLALLVFGFIPIFSYIGVRTYERVKSTYPDLVSKNLWPFHTTVSGIHKYFFCLFFVSFIVLIYIGSKPATEPFVSISRVFTALYFSYFFVILPILAFFDSWYREHRAK